MAGDCRMDGESMKILLNGGTGVDSQTMVERWGHDCYQGGIIA